MKPLFQFAGKILSGLGRRAYALGAPSYYRDDLGVRNELIRRIYSEIDSGRRWFEAAEKPQTRNHGERVVEYPFIYDWLKHHQPGRLLDVGCVMNNPIIDPMIPDSCEVSFLNPASEPIVRSRATYYRRPMEEFHPSEGFPLVTCLSTLEHVGFDNTRYGTTLTDEGWDWSRSIKEWVQRVQQLTRFVSPGGTLIVSCPYGRKEHVLLPPKTGVRTAQVIHSEHVAAMKADPVLNTAVVICVRLEGSGWKQASPTDEYESYGAISPGSSGVIFVEWTNR